MLDNVNCFLYNNFRHLSAGIAQLVEQLICNQQVVGSSPTPATMFFRKTILLNIALLI